MPITVRAALSLTAAVVLVACGSDGRPAEAPETDTPSITTTGARSQVPAATTLAPSPEPAATAPAATAPAATTTTVIPTTGTPPPTTTAPYADAPRFLALGDSYTIGQSVDYEERWPVQLVALLRDAGLAVADPEFIAETGWTSSRLIRAVEETMLVGPFGLVSVQIGVNNQFRGGEVDVFRTELRDLLTRAVALARGDPGGVLVLTIPDYSVTPFAENLPRTRISYEIGLFNDVVAEEAAAAGARLVDVTPSSTKAADDPDLLVFDGLHPSGLMYEEWAALALSHARAAIEGLDTG